MAEATETMVRQLLAEHPRLDADAIGVDAAGGRVTLRGKVRTQRESEEAESAARQVRGVESVENLLVVLGEPI